MSPPVDVPSSAAAELVNMGQMALAFGQVNRSTYHPDGMTFESDTDHTVMLQMTAAAFAARYVDRLDVNLVLKFALVHDLAEVYAGDTPTLSMASQTEDERAAKRRRELDAMQLLADQFGYCFPWLVDAIVAYEAQIVAEARYVKLFDKMVPKITHILNGLRTVLDAGMTYGQLVDSYVAQGLEYKSYLDEFPEVRHLRADLLRILFTEAVGVLPDGPTEVPA